MTSEAQRAYWRETQRRHRELHPRPKRPKSTPAEQEAQRVGAQARKTEKNRVYRESHREEIAAYAKVRWERSPEVHRKNRVNYRKWRYGLTDEAFAGLVAAQGGACAICRHPFDGAERRYRPHVDHDHVTKRVRGVLCLRCNSLLGYAGDNVETMASAIEYLRRNPE